MYVTNIFGDLLRSNAAVTGSMINRFQECRPNSSIRTSVLNVVVVGTQHKITNCYSVSQFLLLVLSFYYFSVR